jgi:NCAIR mutase (PurE)-related protein
MTRSALLQILADVERGELTSEAAAERLAKLPFENLEHTHVDHHRSLRSGYPEVIYAAGKTPQQTLDIFSSLVAAGVDVLATRIKPEGAELLLTAYPQATYNSTARTISLRQTSAEKELAGHIVVVCAGTSDLPVAEEAAVTAETFGARVTRITDVGVAGLHRLLAHLDILRSADALVVCAGMEGALPSVIGGLVSVPVIGVPTSVGYGSAFGGSAALLGMLNACSPNITVVNIDNGFGAGYVATMIVQGKNRK